MTSKNLKLIERFGYLRVICVVCVLIILIEVVLTFAVLFKPIEDIEFVPEYAAEVKKEAEVSNTVDGNSLKIADVYRAGFFKSGGTVGSRPLADKTVERIKSKLRLQCVINMGGEMVAYIHIDGLGLKKCRVGDSVEDMFSVLDIAKGRVEISIVGHKVSLKC